MLAACAETAKFGTPARTCHHESKIPPHLPVAVTFHKIVIPVKAYELRTGKLVTDTTPEIDGPACPKVLHHTRRMFAPLPFS